MGRFNLSHNLSSYPSLAKITFAASLVHLGLLGGRRNRLPWLMLRHDNLASVPTQHLASLVSRVRNLVHIQSCDKIVTILESVKSKSLFISNQNLSSEETRALV